MDLTDHLDLTDPFQNKAAGAFAHGLEGSQILGIAAEVNAMKARGEAVSNFTIGDFDPARYAIPDVLRERIHAELDAGQTRYPPAAGIPELRAAVRSFYAKRLGLSYPEGSVQVGAGARPPIYAAFRTVLDPGDVVIYPTPTWNVRYYVYLNRARGVPIQTRPENGFMPSAADLLPHLGEARMVVMNSPLNPCGTVISKELLTEVCQAIVDENTRRQATGGRPVILLYDQVYWQLTFEGHTHHTPMDVVPEIAPWTVLIDAISKCWAATGMRVGWAVAPPAIAGRMRPLVGHMGAWAARPEQRATAAVLAEPELADPFMADFKQRIEASLRQLSDGLRAMEREGLPVSCLDPQGAIYLSARFGLHGRTLPDGTVIDSDDAARRAILAHAKVAVVPFTAFGYPENTGWVRLSVGAVGPEDIAGALGRLRDMLRSV